MSRPARPPYVVKPSVMMSRLMQASARALVAQGEEAAHVHEGILLGAHHGAIGQGEHALRDLAVAQPLHAVFAVLHEPAVLGDAAAIQQEQHAVAFADRGYGLALAKLTGCPPPLLLVTVRITAPTWP
jgi:hypothetical protein